MRKLTNRAALAAALAGLPTAVAAPGHATPARTLVVTSYEFTFQAPETINGGVVTVRLDNRGKMAHQVVFARLDDTSTLARVMRSLVENKTHTTGVHWVGGVENAIPGGASQSTLILHPGRYVIVCDYDSELGRAHASLGMVRALMVRPGAAAADTVLPAAAVTARLTDYRIDLSAPLHAGRQLVRVENDGVHRHHLAIARIVGTATLADIDKWDGKSLPSPIEDSGAGAAALDPGLASVIDVTLVPGRYVLACILADSSSRKPHYLLGMEREVVAK